MACPGLPRFVRPALTIYILTFAGPPGQLRAVQIGTKTVLIAHRSINRILEYLVTAFADLIHPAADFDQQVAVLRLAGSQHFQIRTADVLSESTAPGEWRPPPGGAGYDPGHAGYGRLQIELREGAPFILSFCRVFAMGSLSLSDLPAHVLFPA